MSNITLALLRGIQEQVRAGRYYMCNLAGEVWEHQNKPYASWDRRTAVREEFQSMLLSEGIYDGPSPDEPWTTASRLVYLERKINELAAPGEKTPRVAPRNRLVDYVRRKAREAGLTIQEAREAAGCLDYSGMESVRQRRVFILCEEFVWSRSPQGHAYWSNVHKRISE